MAVALDYYEKCLRITRLASTLDNISVFVNKIACLLSLEKYASVVSESNNALRLIKNYKNKTRITPGSEEETRLKAMELRVFLRKGNAEAKLNKYVDAIKDYEAAQKIDPDNE